MTHSFVRLFLFFFLPNLVRFGSAKVSVLFIPASFFEKNFKLFFSTLLLSVY